MPIHKLADGPITLQVAKVDHVPNNYDPTKMQYAFTGTNDERVYVSETAVGRQLPRLNLTPETAVGAVLTFEQVKKDGKTFVNINSGSAQKIGAAPATAPAAAAIAAAPKLSMAELGALYGQCVDAAIATLGTKLEEAGVPVTAEAIQAGAATIFIKVTR
jgi:hypothetical protein